MVSCWKAKCAFAALVAMVTALPQKSLHQVASSGDFILSQSATYAGGRSSGGGFTVDGTVGQPAPGGDLQGPGYSLYGGFWSPIPLTPTAAGVTVGGRVRTSADEGIGNARLTLITAEGETWTALSGPFGYFTFTDIPAGRTYILTVSSRRHVFAQPHVVFFLSDATENLDFVGERTQ